MKILYLIGIFAAFAFLSGCCGSTTPSSSSGFCPYGTYGSACTNICSQLNQGEGCFSQCMDGVRAEGLGDATTCCTSTFRQDCDSMCTELEQSTQGDTTKAECMEECFANYATVGIDMDSCAVPL
ncbi:hypothetical protein H0O00_02805 [Candidatus Micrarchaeota archaeon]|nr:hypothetical protein [Candidatus Micrarchaeota archaeon]